MNKEQFAKILYEACELYQEEMTEKRIAVYYQIVSKFNIEDVELAFNAHYLDIDYGHRFPLPSDIYRQIRGKKSIRRIV